VRNQCASRSTDAALWWSFPWRSMSGFVRRRSAQTKPQQVSGATRMHGLSERDICSKFITPALTAAGWSLHTQIREEVNLRSEEHKSELQSLMRISYAVF